MKGLAAYQALSHINSVQLPLTIPLQNSSQTLSATQVLRAVADKRVVLVGQWQDQNVVAKLFLNPRKAQAHRKRELRGIQRLQRANIRTPNLIQIDEVRDTHIQVLIFEYLNPSISFETLCHTTSGPVDQQLPILQQLIAIIGQQHNAGLIQQDLHLKNFLLYGQHIYSLDPAELDYHPRLSRSACLKHLGLLFAQLIPPYDRLWHELYTIYAQTRGWQNSTVEFELLCCYTQQWRSYRLKRYMKKIFRTCSAFIAKKNWRQHYVCERAAFTTEMQSFLKAPEDYLNKSQVKILKAGNSCTLFLVKMDQRFIVVKRYNMKNFWHRLKRCLRESRASKCWRNAHTLSLLGIPTAKPLAFLEQRFGWLRSTAYLVMEYLEGAPADQYFNQANGSDQVIATQCVDLLRRLSDFHIEHGDLKASNIWVVQDKVYLLDLDAMQRYTVNVKAFAKVHQKDVKRFLKNWSTEPSVKLIFEQLLQGP